MPFFFFFYSLCVSRNFCLRIKTFSSWEFCFNSQSNFFIVVRSMRHLPFHHFSQVCPEVFLHHQYTPSWHTYHYPVLELYHYHRWKSHTHRFLSSRRPGQLPATFFSLWICLFRTFLRDEAIQYVPFVISFSMSRALQNLFLLWRFCTSFLLMPE